MDGILKELSGISVETLRQQLQSYGESVGPITGTTKYLFVKKLAKKKFDERFPNTSSPGNVDGTIVSTEQQGIVSKSPPSDADNSSAQGAQGFNADNSGDVTYYGISLPTDLVDSGVHKASPLVFTDKSTALKTLKAHKGSRFKTFKNRAEAECFSKSVVDQISSPLKPSVSDLGNVSSVEAIAFKSLKMPELVALRRLIEKGDCDAVRELVWSNPRYLISSGDTPVILQEGFRYNALHVAAKGNQARVCELILGVVQDPEFVRTLYPMDTELTCNSRVHFLTDLYLNMPDKGFCESPLHFACKFGYAEVVEVLASHPSTDRQLANKHGETPAQVVCSRCDSTAQAERIKSLLEDCCFVPLLRSEDNCTQAVIGEPWSPDTVQRSSLTTGGLSQSPCDPQLVVRAYAGPMSPSMAETFHKRWTTPPSGSPSHLRRRLSEIRREDCEKGEERIGRKLSQELNVAWAEYWQFLKAYIDLSSTKGLTLLNNYLRGQYVKLFPEDSSVDQERLLEKNLKNSELRENESPRILDCSGTEGVENVTGSDLKYPDGFMGADRLAEMDAKYRDRQRRDSQSSVSSSSSESNYSSCMSGSDSSDDEKFHNSIDTTMSGPHSFRQEGPGPPSPVIRDPLLHWDGLTSPGSPNNAELRGQANSDSHTNPWAPQPSAAPQRASPQSGGDYSCPQGLDASHPSVPGAFTTYRSARSSSTDLDNSLERSTSVETESDLVLPNYQSENSLDRPSNDSMDQMISSLTSEMQNKLLISWAMKDTESCGNLSFDALAASQNSGHVFDQHGVDRARSAASSSCVEGKSSQPCLAQSSLVQKRTDSPGVFSDTPNRPFLPPANHLTPIPHLSAGPTPHTTHTPERKPQRPTGAFIEGGEATKLDVDVLRALGDTPIDAQLYPYIARWKRLVTSYDEDTQHSWPTPARLRASRSGHGSPQLTSSPVSRLHPQSPLALPTQSFPQSSLASPAQTQRLHPPRFNLLEELKRSSDPT